jgi:hypothetical protein
VSLSLVHYTYILIIMSSLSWVVGGLLAFGSRMAMADETEMCVSYGMDFQDGGSYFQNSLSNDNFTFVSQFDSKLRSYIL